MRTRLRHYCNARSSFFQFVSGFPSTVKLLPSSQIAQQLKKHEKIKHGQRFSTRFPMRNGRIQLRESGFFPRLKRTTLSFFVQNKLCVCRSRQVQLNMLIIRSRYVSLLVFLFFLEFPFSFNSWGMNMKIRNAPIKVNPDSPPHPGYVGL